MKKVLVVNRGEIAIRVFRACTELGLRTAGIYSYEDRYSLHRYKADESYQVGKQSESVRPYLDIDEIIYLAKKIGADAIHPGYGFLSENEKFVHACEQNQIKFIGPNSKTINDLGNKINAKLIAEKSGVPIIKGGNADTVQNATELATQIGFPVMIKAAAGGGGRGMRVIRDADELSSQFDSAKNEALSAFGDGQLFIEKYIENPKHIEVQILGDEHGNLVHLYERDCSVQRRFQKVIEFAPSITLSEIVREKIYDYALKITTAVNYQNAGTVEFLVENDEVYFIEVNPRIQVEHTVTEMITGIDIVKSQLLIAQGKRLDDLEIDIQGQESIKCNGYALQCRITTEDPQNDFQPDYGKVLHYRNAAGFGIRLDEGNIYNGAVISPFFDSMLVKISAWAPRFETACQKMKRSLLEFRVRGVKTNVQFLENVMDEPQFYTGLATVHFIKNNPHLFQFEKRQDRGTKLLKYIAETTVNGNPDVKVFDETKTFYDAKVPDHDKYTTIQPGSRNYLLEHGPEKLAQWLKDQPLTQITDTTMRDAHQSLIATRMRSKDMLAVMEGYARNFPHIFSMEVWGGATFDVSYRFLKEDPWQRLIRMREAAPNILFQMLLRGSNAVGYTAYPDNLIERFIVESNQAGIDIFRIFDSLNWTNAMKLSIETVREKTQGIAEACICYTGDILNTQSKKYNLDYYIQLAQELEHMGAHILAIKDMAGLLKPYAAEVLIKELKAKINIPIHLHTHDTSGLQMTTYLKAIESGVDAIDVALGGLSGLTSQPNFNSLVEMLKHTPHEIEFNQSKLNEYSDYWETVRELYYPFESGMKSSSADVYFHEIPGGQYSNLKPQAISLGLGDKMPEIKKAYHDVNQLFGDIIKVTPSSKVVGDLALYLVSNGMSVEDVLSRGESFPFPESVIGFFRGDLGQPYQGFPKELQRIILKCDAPLTRRAGEHLPDIDLTVDFEKFKSKYGSKRTFLEFLSSLLYPKVYEDYYQFVGEYGHVMNLSSEIFFYGMRKGQETLIELEPGKTLIVKLISVSKPDVEGKRRVFFEMNGQGRIIFVEDKSIHVEKIVHEKGDLSNPEHISAPLPGLLSKINVKGGQKVKKGDTLCIIEAMKMETQIKALNDGIIERIVLNEGVTVDQSDLIIEVSSGS